MSSCNWNTWFCLLNEVVWRIFIMIQHDTVMLSTIQYCHLLQGSIGKSRKGNLAWDTNLFLGGAVLPTSRQNSGGVIKLPLIILLQIQKLCSFLSRPYFFVITIHHNFSHDNTVCHWRWLMVFSKRRQLKLIWLIFESDLKI